MSESEEPKFNYKYPLKKFFKLHARHGSDPVEYRCIYDGQIFDSQSARRHVYFAHSDILEKLLKEGIAVKVLRTGDDGIDHPGYHKVGRGPRPHIKRVTTKSMIVQNREQLLKWIGREDCTNSGGSK